MYFHNRDHGYTLTLAETAIEQIRSLLLPSDPSSFEIWYTYAGRFVPALNQAINDALANGRKPSAVEIEQIYDRHLGTFRFGEQIEQIGEKFSADLKQILTEMDAAVRSTAGYGDNLGEIGRKLDQAADRNDVRAIVEALVSATRSAIADSRFHRARFEATRDEVEQLRRDLDDIRAESRTDALTTLANRKEFDAVLTRAIADAAQSRTPLSMLMCDVDYFKNFNDTWGHPFGDDVLRLIARATKEIIRRHDIAARYGGDEFAVILPNTALPAAEEIAERLRVEVNTKSIIQRSTGHNLGRVSVSIGIAQWRDDEPVRDFVERADTCLYAAKKNGRNRVVRERL